MSSPPGRHAVPPASDRPSSRYTLASLRHRDFLLLWLGQLVSSTGDQMQIVAIAWHVYVLTGSALQVGLIAVFRLLPFLALSFIGGAFADAADRKRVIVWASALQVAVNGVLVAAVFGGQVAVWMLFAVTFVSGAATAFDQPARTALLANVVPREEMSNAFTLLILLRQVAQIAGPGLGGLAIAGVGLGATYLANTASFVAVIGAVAAMGPVPAIAAEARGGWERILGGLRYARTDRLIVLPLAMDIGTRLFVSSRPLLPILAGEVFLMGPRGLGWLSTATSLGALVGGLALGAGRQLRQPLRLMLIAFAAEGLFVIGLGCTPLLAQTRRLEAFGLALVMLFGAGVCDVLSNVPRTTLIQLRTPDELRGRISAFMSMCSSTGPQLGQVEMGAMAAALGPAWAAIISGVVATLLPFVSLAPARTRQDVLAFSLSSLEEPTQSGAMSGIR